MRRGREEQKKFKIRYVTPGVESKRKVSQQILQKRVVVRLTKMKLISASIILILQVLGTSFASQQCEETCKEIRPTILNDGNRCAPALTINPSPKVYKACQDGSKKAFDMACVQMCATTETATSFERKSSKACKTNRSRGPSEHWCKRGFASVVKKLYTYDFPENEPEIIDTEPPQENVVVDNEASSVVENDVDGPETKAEAEEDKKVEVIEAEAEAIAEMVEEVTKAKDKTIEAEPELEPVTEMEDLEVNSIEPEPELEPEEPEHVHAFEKLEENDDDEEEEPEIDDNANIGYSEF